jgi:hypothetical protein
MCIEVPRRKQRGIFTGAKLLSPQAAGNLPVEIKNERTATLTRYKRNRKRKRGCGMTRNPLIFMVGGTGIEPVTSTV